MPYQGKNIYHWTWDPSDVLVLGHDSYLIAGTFGGVYLLEPDDRGSYRFVALDQEIGAPITL